MKIYFIYFPFTIVLSNNFLIFLCDFFETINKGLANTTIDIENNNNFLQYFFNNWFYEIKSSSLI